MVRTAWLSIEHIAVSSKQRKKVSPKKVDKHRKAFEEDRFVEPIDVVSCRTDDQERYRILGNGRHRYFGALEAGMPLIECRIHDSRHEDWDTHNHPSAPQAAAGVFLF